MYNYLYYQAGVTRAFEPYTLPLSLGTFENYEITISSA